MVLAAFYQQATGLELAPNSDDNFAGATSEDGPPEFRCNAVVRNIDDFHTALSVTDSDKMWLSPEDRVRIW